MGQRFPTKKQMIPLRPRLNDFINKQSSSVPASSRADPAVLPFVAPGPSCSGSRVPVLLNFFHSSLFLLGVLFLICRRAPHSNANLSKYTRSHKSTAGRADDHKNTYYGHSVAYKLPIPEQIVGELSSQLTTDSMYSLLYFFFSTHSCRYRL